MTTLLLNILIGFKQEHNSYEGQDEVARSEGYDLLVSSAASSVSVGNESESVVSERGFQVVGACGVTYFTRRVRQEMDQITYLLR